MADQTPLDLTAIQARADEAATAMRHWRTHGGTAGVTYVAASAEDVPALLAEIQRLRHEVFVLTNSDDARAVLAETERDRLRAQRDAVLALCDKAVRHEWHNHDGEEWEMISACTDRCRDVTAWDLDPDKIRAVYAPTGGEQS